MYVIRERTKCFFCLFFVLLFIAWYSVFDQALNNYFYPIVYRCIEHVLSFKLCHVLLKLCFAHAHTHTHIHTAFLVVTYNSKNQIV